jgi:hypothetical protein
MAGRKRKPGQAANTRSLESELPVVDKIARLLALIVVRDMDTDEAALKLDGVGFSGREIGTLLGVGLNYANLARHRNEGSRHWQSRRLQPDQTHFDRTQCAPTKPRRADASVEERHQHTQIRDP